MLLYCTLFLLLMVFEKASLLICPSNVLCCILKPQHVGCPVFTYEPDSKSGRDWLCRSDTSSPLPCRCTGHTPGPGLPRADSPASHHSGPSGRWLKPSLHPWAGPPEHHIPDTGCRSAAEDSEACVPGTLSLQSLCQSLPLGGPLLRKVPASPDNWCKLCANKARVWGL